MSAPPGRRQRLACPAHRPRPESTAGDAGAGFDRRLLADDPSQREDAAAPPFAWRGVEVARKELDDAFSKIRALDIEILTTETFVNGDVGVVGSVQRGKVVTEDGTAPRPMLVRQTYGFERSDRQWRVIHEHISAPSPASAPQKLPLATTEA